MREAGAATESHKMRGLHRPSRTGRRCPQCRWGLDSGLVAVPFGFPLAVDGLFYSLQYERAAQDSAVGHAMTFERFWRPLSVLWSPLRVNLLGQPGLGLVEGVWNVLLHMANLLR